MKELMTGKRHSIHELLMQVIEASASETVTLPIPKTDPIPTGATTERLDVRAGQKQLDILDTLRDQLKPRTDILDIREYYGRVDVLRALLKMEILRTNKEFLRWMNSNAQPQSDRGAEDLISHP